MINSSEYSDIGSFDESTIRTLEQEIVKLQGDFNSHEAKYVCSTTTIPLCTTLNMDYDRQGKTDKYDWMLHDKEICKGGCCQFYSAKNKEATCQFIEKSSPINRNLQAICWLAMVKNLKDFGFKNGIEAAEVAFCPDSKSVLDSDYPAIVKDKTHLRGFESIKTAGNAVDILSETYWFSKFAGKKHYKLVPLVEKLAEKCRITIGDTGKNLRDRLHSILNTINGFIVKKILYLGRECVNYRTLAEQTAMVFRELCIEYTVTERSELPRFKQKQELLYVDAKRFFPHIKRHFNHDDIEVRKRVYDYKFRNSVLKNFFRSELRNLKSTVDRKERGYEGDYTTTIAWNYKCAHLCQTRTLDHIPELLAIEQIDDYIAIMKRDIYFPTEREMNVVHTAVERNLTDNKVERNFFRNKENFINEEVVKDAVQMELKNTASYHSTVDEGGKLEDARLFLKDAKENGWMFPIRDLDNGEIIGYTTKITDDSWDEKGALNLSSVIFWGSLQICTNFLHKYGEVPKRYYYPLRKNGKEWIAEDLINARLIGILEPGKLRLLLKSVSFLNWALSPGSKLLQKGLAEHPDHKAGLEAASQDWSFAKRLSGESHESDFLYDKNGRILSTSHFGQTDWSKATDLLAKLLGFQMMKTYMRYSGFPEYYSMIILYLTRMPFMVKHTAYVTSANEEIIVDEKTHMFKEGFMMGVQVTKTYLHLSHIATEGLVALWAQRKGFLIEQRKKGMVPLKDQLPYDSATSKRPQTIRKFED